MKVSLNFVKRYVDLAGITPEDIAAKLTMAGLEVEAITRAAVGTNLITAFVQDATLMEGSDHLTLCQVDDGQATVQVVCGAPNIKTGQTIILAKPGAELAVGKIAHSKIRGHDSHGMICSLLELGVDEKTLSAEQRDGIEVLAPETPIGRQDVLGLLGLDDTIIHIKLLANRPDALALHNIAKEIALLCGRPIKPWTQPLPQGSVSSFKVHVTTTLCPQVTIRAVHGIGSAPTPEYIKRALTSSGMRPLTPLVDIGNYVMLLTGQPLHIYDCDRLPVPELTIRSDLNQTFLALDGKNYEVRSGDITITSGGAIACLAGIMGSAATAVSAMTKNIIIEAANFKGATIRQTATRLNLPSESSIRFIKGINPHQTEDVLDMTINLIGEVLGYETYSRSYGHDVISHERKRIPFTYAAINGKLGTAFTEGEIDAVLAQVGMLVIKEDQPVALVPPQRIDIDGVADLAEEVIRLRGFDHIEVTLPHLKALHTGLNLTQTRMERLRELLRNRGLDEVLSYTLRHHDETDKFRLLNHDPLHHLANPMTDEHEYVRGGLVYSLLQTANYNVARQNKDLALFEISGIETMKKKTTHLGLILVGQKPLRGQLSTKPYDFYDAKGLFEAIMTLLGIEGGRYRYERYDTNPSELHPGQSATILVENKPLGVLGVLSPEATPAFDFKKAPVVVMEIDIGALLDLRVGLTKMSPLSRFPTVIRDLAIVIDNDIEASTIIKAIRKTQKDIIRDVSIFDVYTGTGIPEGKKSLALSIALNNDKKTLTETECSETIERIKVALAQSFSASFRI